MQGLLDRPPKPALPRGAPPEIHFAKTDTETALGGGGAFKHIVISGDRPLKYTDPDGKKFKINGSIIYYIRLRIELFRVERDLKKSGNQADIQQFKDIKDDKNFIVTIQKPDNESNQYDPNTNILSFDPDIKEGGLDASGNTERPSHVGLGHEIKHAIDDKIGVINKNWQEFLDGEITGETYHYRTEDSAINFENSVREGFYGEKYEQHKRLPAAESHTYSGSEN